MVNGSAAGCKETWKNPITTKVTKAQKKIIVINRKTFVFFSVLGGEVSGGEEDVTPDQSVCMYARRAWICSSVSTLPKPCILFLPIRMMSSTRSSLAGRPLMLM